MKNIEILIPIKNKVDILKIDNELKDFTSEYKKLKFSFKYISIFETDVDSNFNVVKADKNNIENEINNLLKTSQADYVILANLNSTCWRKKIAKIIEGLDEGNDICRISKLFIPSSIFCIIANFFITLHYIFLSILAYLYGMKHFIACDENFIGLNSELVDFLNKTEINLNKIRYTDALVMFSEKTYRVKNDNSSNKINHLTKFEFDKNSVFTILTGAFLAIFYLVAFLLLRNTYVVNDEIGKFIALVILITVLSLFIMYYLFMYRRIRKVQNE